MKSKKHDKKLFIVVGLLNTWSGYATISGAMQILPMAVGIPAGAIVQTILLLMLSRQAADHAPARKWIAILVCTLASIYTSFYTYYEQLSGNQRTMIAYDKAKQAHHSLVQEVYTPIEQKLNSIETKVSKHKKLGEYEIRKGLFTGERGYGPKAKEIDIIINDLEAQNHYYKTVVNDLSGKFLYPLEGITPAQILEKDRAALAAVPLKLRGNYPDLKRSLYIDTDNDVLLLTPYLKVVKMEVYAIVSLLIALTVDGTAIVLGTAIVVSKRKSFWESLSEQASAQIDGVKLFSKNIGDSIDSPAISSLRNIEVKKLDLPLNVVRGLKIKGSQFLTLFYLYTNPKSGKVDFKGMEKRVGNYACFFRMLLDELRHPDIGWAELRNDDWYIIPDRYFKFHDWLLNEISRHQELEASNAYASNSNINMSINVPSSPNYLTP